ncbi:MAG TPA: carboxypeptidase-like regulatory domain-containing protein [Chitinophagaceae bacterium]
MRLPLIILLIVTYLLGCNKEFKKQDPKDDFKGSEELTGRITFRNLHSGNGREEPLAGKKVYLAYTPSDTANYLYYTLTDAQGNFRFDHLYEGKGYTLYTRDTINNVLYTSYTEFTPPKDKINIVAVNDTLRQTGILFYVVDANGQPFPGARLCLFNNEQLFLGDTCTGSIGSNTTDTLGRVVFYNIKEGQYYAKVKTNAGNTPLKGDTSFLYQPNAVTPITLRLKTTTSARNGIEVTTVNEQNHIMPNTQVCLFNNPAFFLTDSCTKAIVNTSTNSNGTHMLPNLEPGRYYLLAQQTFRDSLYKGTSIIDVTAVGVQKTRIVLQATSLVKNQIRITVNDETGSPVAQTQLCLFNSQVLFNADTCLGNIDRKMTDLQGKAQFTNLPEGRYYIRARAAFSNLVLKGSDIIDLSQNAAVDRTIFVRQ